MNEFYYEKMTLDEQLQAIDSRLYDLERNHYHARLAVVQGVDEPSIKANQDSAKKLEKQILNLRQERDSLSTNAD